MSHEIRTPMTAILGFSDILASELSNRVTEQHYTFLRSISVSGKRLLSLINDILDLSKIEAGRLEMEFQDLDVAAEIDAALSPLAWIAKQKSLATNVVHYPDRLNIYADRQRLGQVLTNIIGNAIKFTRQGSITVRTVVRQPARALPGEGQKFISIEIEDTGIGISEDFLPYLFDEFRQEHGGSAKEYGGTGLGLAISRRLVTLMDGTLEVHSQPNVGTMFSIVLPLSEPGAHGTKPSLKREVSDVVRVAVAPSQKTSAKGPLVLVVEDNIETQRLIQVYLKGSYRVVSAANAEEAFEAIERDVPDVILMDINLPGKDGLTITREIRAGTRCPNIPIVALTAFAMTGDRQRCLEAGCTDYLTKPATKREVLEMINRVVAEAK
jgi:CheY-like chemotaxis protein